LVGWDAKPEASIKEFREVANGERLIHRGG
jgi:hypothetical protein